MVEAFNKGDVWKTRSFLSLKKYSSDLLENAVSNRFGFGVPPFVWFVLSRN